MLRKTRTTRFLPTNMEDKNTFQILCNFLIEGSNVCCCSKAKPVNQVFKYECKFQAEIDYKD